MTTAESDRLFEPIASPEEVSQGIIDLTDQTFDRMAGRIAMYGRDPRRAITDDQIDLEISGESRAWDNGTNGQLVATIHNRASLIETAQQFMGDWRTQDAMRIRSHYNMINRSSTGFPARPRFLLAGYTLSLHILRDRYPRGNTGARGSLFEADAAYLELPPEEWGERHKAGIELGVRFDDVLSPVRPARWRFGIFLQTRFDKPAPQIEVKSTFDGLVEAKDIAMYNFHTKMSQTSQAGMADVERMAELFKGAKDIRPSVTPVDRLVRERHLLRSIIGDFFDKDVLEPTPK